MRLRHLPSKIREIATCMTRVDIKGGEQSGRLRPSFPEIQGDNSGAVPPIFYAQQTLLCPEKLVLIIIKQKSFPPKNVFFLKP